MANILSGTVNDIPIIQKIAERTWRHAYASILTPEQMNHMLNTIYSERALRQAMKSGFQDFIVLHDDNGPQGFAAYGLKPENQRICKLHKLYVLPANHGKGYGRMLIDTVKRRAEETHASILELHVNRYNSARLFYEKMGFNIIGEVDIPIGPYFMNDYIMQMELKPVKI